MAEIKAANEWLNIVPHLGHRVGHDVRWLVGGDNEEKGDEATVRIKPWGRGVRSCSTVSLLRFKARFFRLRVQRYQLGANVDVGGSDRRDGCMFTNSDS